MLVLFGLRIKMGICHLKHLLGGYKRTDNIAGTSVGGGFTAYNHSLGVVPRLAICLGRDSVAANMNWCVGYDLADDKACLYIYNNGAAQNTILWGSTRVERDVNNKIYGYISSWNTTRIVINWVVIGACSIDWNITLIG